MQQMAGRHRLINVQANANMDIHADLISRCKRGERNAQFELYRLYSKAMFAVCRNILSDPMEAEDAMQEAFFKAFDKMEQFSGQVAFGAWLRRIAVNTSIDHLKRKRPDMLSLDEFPSLDSRPSLAAENENVESCLEAVMEAMQQLPNGYRLVLTLRLVEEYDYPDIAQMMGTSQSNARSQYSRAKQRLLELLQNKGLKCVNNSK